ncbi:hypothetical protein AMYBAR_005268 [Amycolatopsis bartoniae]|uniref:hypothetical protein n=1 Tax=Amycolatopsis bartoniae TaxID=941986 RepID=UPI001193D6F3|nr:hypothetical protein [Amycolatopsis bartoniae]TVT11305.1 hypothetical protein FNH07_02610 [Amycolatopsis bartoniae]
MEVLVASPFGGLMKGYVDPAMKDAGFVRTRSWLWSMASPQGHAVFVEMRPNPLTPKFGFYVEWAPVPVVLMDYFGSGAQPGRSEIGWGLISTHLTPPADLAWEPSGMMPMWGFYPDRVDEYGLRLRDHFQGVAIPRWKRFLDLPTLAEEFYRRTDLEFFLTTRGYGEDFGKVILEVDDGDPQELEKLIDELIAAGGDRDLLEWLRRRLHARSVG